jgi:hypothetical protein
VVVNSYNKRTYIPVERGDAFQNEMDISLCNARHVREAVVASANCGVGRELPDTVAVMRELWQRTPATHVPQLLMTVGPLRKGNSFNSRRTDGRLQGRLFRRQSRDQIINRLLAKALVRVAPPQLQMTEISFKDLPLYSYDYRQETRRQTVPWPIPQKDLPSF